MTPKATQVSGSSFCAHCGLKIWEDAESGRWYHPLAPCRVTKKDEADLALKSEDIERELAELDRIDQEMEGL